MEVGMRVLKPVVRAIMPFICISLAVAVAADNCEAQLPMEVSWTVEGDQINAYMGYPVASAGDVNGDGYSDIVVGAWRYDNGDTDEGAVFLYQGGPSGLSATPNWTAEGNQPHAHFGISASSAGDVNGDGYSDVIVGAYLYDNGEADEGGVFVYHGSPSGLSTPPAWTAESNTVGGQMGYAVSTAGDVNGDGYSDVAVKGPYHTVYVYHGSASGLAASPSLVLNDPRPDSDFGGFISSAGDVNGDGYSDIIVSAHFYSNGQYREGAAFVYHGSATGLSETYDWMVESNQGSAFFGYVFPGAAGDVNGDGYSDVAIGASGYDSGQSDEGKVFVYHGSPSGLSTTPAWTAESNQNGAGVGEICIAGDVNGDGYSDAIVGFPFYDHGEADEGIAYLHLGSPSGLLPTPAWSAEGNSASARFGNGVSNASDVNGDGFDDIVVGALGYDDEEANEGAVFAYYTDPGATPIGTDVVVSPIDETTGSSPVTFTFDEVTEVGSTSLTTGDSGQPPPAGFRLGNPPVYFELATTAVHAGYVEVCIDYSSISFGNESKLKLFHLEGGTWVDRTISLDTAADIICAQVSSFSSFAILEELPGSVEGRVLADCPVPDTGLLGVVVDAYEVGSGDLVKSCVTDEAGYYVLDALWAGDYVTTIVTPLGYSTAAEEVPVTVTAGSVVVVDFGLSCLSISANPRSMGFWKHQVGVATGGRGQGQVDASTLCDYLDLIGVHFNSNQINAVEVYIPPLSGLCEDKLVVAGDLLNLRGSVAMISRARQQLLALLLNVAGEKISIIEVISADGATVSQAITYCDNLIDDPDGDHELAKTIADDINNGREVATGIIPLDTQEIAYSRPVGSSEVVLGYAQPNPTHGATRISYSVPVQGAHVLLEIYDVAGRRVRKLAAGHRTGGPHQVVWWGDDESGHRVAAGVYLYRLQIGEWSDSRKVIVLR